MGPKRFLRLRLVTITLMLILGNLAALPTLHGTAWAASGQYETPGGAHVVTWDDGWLHSVEEEPGVDWSLVNVGQRRGSVSVHFFIAHDNRETFPRTIMEIATADARDEGFLLDEWKSDGADVATIEVDVEGVASFTVMMLLPSTGSSGSVLVVFSAPVDEFIDGYEIVQKGVYLNGKPPFLDLTSEELWEVVGEEGNSTSLDNEFPESSELYRDLTYDYNVSYSSPWSSASPNAGDLSLQDNSFNTVSFMGMPFFGSRSSFVDIMESTWRGSGGTYLGTVEGDDRVLLVTQVSGGGILAQEIIFLDSTSVVVVSVALIGDAEAAVRSLQQHVFVNGEPILEDWDRL